MCDTAIVECRDIVESFLLSAMNIIGDDTICRDKTDNDIDTINIESIDKSIDVQSLFDTSGIDSTANTITKKIISIKDIEYDTITEVYPESLKSLSSLENVPSIEKSSRLYQQITKCIVKAIDNDNDLFTEFIPEHKFADETYNRSVYIKAISIDDDEVQEYLLSEIYTCNLLSRVDGCMTFIGWTITNGYLVMVTEYIAGDHFYDIVFRYSNSSMLFLIIKPYLKSLFKTLYRLYRDYKFTHYDLHLKNVICVSGSIYIIDYEYVYTEYNGFIKGMNEQKPLYCFSRTRPSWVTDIVRILSNIYNMSSNTEILKMLSFFNIDADFIKKHSYQKVHLNIDPLSINDTSVETFSKFLDFVDGF